MQTIFETFVPISNDKIKISIYMLTIKDEKKLFEMQRSDQFVDAPIGTNYWLNSVLDDGTELFREFLFQCFQIWCSIFGVSYYPPHPHPNHIRIHFHLHEKSVCILIHIWYDVRIYYWSTITLSYSLRSSFPLWIFPWILRELQF